MFVIFLISKFNSFTKIRDAKYWIDLLIRKYYVIILSHYDTVMIAFN